MEPPPLRSYDVYASNLLFGTLAIRLGEYLYYLVVEWEYVRSSPLREASLNLLLLQLGIGATIFYAIRQGHRWAKIVFLVFYLSYVYLTTTVRDFLLAGIPLAQFDAYQLPAVVRNGLALWSLVLLFSKKPCK